ncbi:MAG: hypothetical protein KAG18_02920, partial [Sinobacterium sp.]|nr:hypothetical protein [Sinobacterium sp.]
MDTVKITYRINFDDKDSEVFDFNLDEETFNLVLEDTADLPKWTELSFRQCSHCPLNEAEHTHCPLAKNMYHIVERFHDTKSIDVVEMDVTTAERRVIQSTALQQAIASMFDLIFPTCGCPKTEYMKPLARFHLPLASEEETVFRVTSMYLLAQYFLRTSAQGGLIELHGLADIYGDMNILNKAVASRLQYATQSDSAKNAIALLDMYSTLVPVLVEDELAELRGFFKAYFPEGELEVATTNYLEKAKSHSFEMEEMAEENLESGAPAWMREAKGGGSESPVAEDAAMLAADKILQGSSLSLS